MNMRIEAFLWVLTSVASDIYSEMKLLDPWQFYFNLRESLHFNIKTTSFYIYTNSYYVAVFSKTDIFHHKGKFINTKMFIGR